LRFQDLTDDAYIKRHQRLELDEKRRKRWDLQRQRELSAYEHLRRDDTQINGGHSTCLSRCSSADIDDGTCLLKYAVNDKVIANMPFIQKWNRHSQSGLGLSVPVPAL